jgi:hypothetical protein
MTEENKNTKKMSINIQRTVSPPFAKAGELTQREVIAVPVGITKDPIVARYYDDTEEQLPIETTPQALTDVMVYRHAYSAKRQRIAQADFEVDAAQFLATNELVRDFRHLLLDTQLAEEIVEAMLPENSTSVRQNTAVVPYLKLQDNVTAMIAKRSKVARASAPQRSNIAAILIELTLRVISNSSFVRRLKPLVTQEIVEDFAIAEEAVLKQAIVAANVEKAFKAFKTDKPLVDDSKAYVSRSLYVGAVHRLFTLLASKLNTIIAEEDHVSCSLSLLCMYLNRDAIQGMPPEFREDARLQTMARNASLCRIALQHGMEKTPTDTAGWERALDTMLRSITSTPILETIPLSEYAEYFGHTHFAVRGGLSAGSLFHKNVRGSESLKVFTAVPVTKNGSVEYLDHTDVVGQRLSALAGPIVELSTADILPPVTRLMRAYAEGIFKSVMENNIEDALNSKVIYTMGGTAIDIWFYAAALAGTVYPYLKSDSSRGVMFRVEHPDSLADLTVRKLEKIHFTSLPEAVIGIARPHSGTKYLGQYSDQVAGNPEEDYYMKGSVRRLEKWSTCADNLRVHAGGAEFNFVRPAHVTELLGVRNTESLEMALPFRTHLLLKDFFSMLPTLLDNCKSLMDEKEATVFKFQIALYLRDLFTSVARTSAGTSIVDGLRLRAVNTSSSLKERVLLMTELSSAIARVQMELYVGKTIYKMLGLLDSDLDEAALKAKTKPGVAKIRTIEERIEDLFNEVDIVAHTAIEE